MIRIVGVIVGAALTSKHKENQKNNVLLTVGVIVNAANNTRGNSLNIG